MGREIKITPVGHYERKLEDKSHSFFVIAAEGKETERTYFEVLKDKYQHLFHNKRLQIEVLERPKNQENDSSPIAVKRMIEEFLEHNDFDYNKIEDVRPNDVYCLVVDTDRWTKESLERLSIFCKDKQQFNLMISNPCFELWLILHFSILDEEMKKIVEECKEKERSDTTKKIWKKIKPQLEDENIFKNLQLEDLKLALERAKELDQNPEIDYPVDFLITKVYQVIEKMGLLKE